MRTKSRSFGSGWPAHTGSESFRRWRSSARPGSESPTSGPSTTDHCCAWQDPPASTTLGGILNSQVEMILYLVLYSRSAAAIASSFLKSAAESVVREQ